MEVVGAAQLALMVAVVSIGVADNFAAKNSVTYALKVAAKTLGDQFGLSLYDKGSTGPLVGTVVPYEKEATDA